MSFNPKFKLGQKIFVVTDCDQIPHQVTGITQRSEAEYVYGITLYTRETWHRDFELSIEQDMVLKTSNL